MKQHEKKGEAANLAARETGDEINTNPPAMGAGDSNYTADDDDELGAFGKLDERGISLTMTFCFDFGSCQSMPSNGDEQVSSEHRALGGT